MVLPSCTSTGTTPRGFIALNSGVSCSPLARLRWWLVHGTFFSARTMRTFCAHTEMLL